MNMNGASASPAGAGGRRAFLKQAAAIAIGVILGLIPLGAGISVLLDPLRRRSTAAGFVRITTLDALPADGVPRKFPVLANRVDAWNKFVAVPIGAVYLRRTPDGQVRALNVVCPHAGCFVDFQPTRSLFVCPCHNSSFHLNGQIADRSSPAPRAMDSLEVEIRKGSEVWVRFLNFEAGRPEKIPAA